MVTIFLAEDHKIVRQGLRALIESEPEFEVCGETGDGLEAVQLVEQLKPYLLVVDLMMPGLGGIEVIRQVRARSPKTHIIVLSMYDDQSYVLESFRNGAEGYVLKGDSVSELVRAVHTVRNGGIFLSSPLDQDEIKQYLALNADQSSDPYDQLTNREREVLYLAAAGCNNAEIGGRLSISQRTVETHRANMMHKLKLQNQVELARYAIKRGLVP